MVLPPNYLDNFRMVKPAGVSRGFYLVPKNGGASLETLFAQQMAQEREKLKAFMADARENGTAVRLTEEQKRLLSERFDPREMSREDYRAFVDQLCQWGVIGREDTQYVSVSPMEGLTPVDFAEPTAVLTSSRTDRHYSRDFSTSGGNVLDWARYMATFEGFNPDTRAFEKTRSAILFGKLRDVLEMIA